jgi:hypothetical protein
MRTRTIRTAGRVDLWLALSFSMVSVAACSSSSSPAAKDDAGGSGDATSPPTDSGTTGPLNLTCGQLAGIAGGTPTACTQGQTCCTTFSLASILNASASSVCVAKGTCTGVSNECNTSADCTGGQVCCSGTPADASTEGGAPSIGGFNLGALDTTCQSSCSAGQTQQCATDSECPSGQTCQSAASRFGGGGGGDAGLGAFADAGFDAAAFGDAGVTIPMFCAAPFDGGTAPTPDSGEEVDSGTTVVVDAGVDASVPQ